MFLVYVDESGAHHKSDASENYVLAGFVINERNWRMLDDAINATKAKHFPTIQNIEIHTADIIHGQKEFLGVDVKLRVQFLEDIAEIISAANIKIFCVVMKKANIYSDGIILNRGYEYFYERIAWNVEYLNKARRESGGEEESAIVFLDWIGEEKLMEKVRLKLSGLILRGSSFDHNRMIIEDPIFTNSKYRGNIQLADTLAFTFNHENRSRINNHVGIRNALSKIYSAALGKMVKPSKEYPAYSYKVWP